MATLYVSAQNGNDTNDGLTAAAPKRTITAAMNVIGVGATGVEDFIYIGSGIYQESLIQSSTYAGSKLSVIGDRDSKYLTYDKPGKVFVEESINTDSSTNNNKEFSGTDIRWTFYKNFVLKGIDFRNTRTGAYTVYVSGGSPSATIEDCTFDRIMQSYVIGLSSASIQNSTDRVVIKNCTFTNSISYAIYSPKNTSGAGNLHIYNCMFDGMHSAGIYSTYHLNGVYEISGCTFVNCGTGVQSYYGTKASIVNCHFKALRNYAIYNYGNSTHPASAYFYNCGFEQNVSAIYTASTYTQTYAHGCHFYLNRDVCNTSGLLSLAGDSTYPSNYYANGENGDTHLSYMTFNEYNETNPFPFGLTVDKNEPLNGLQSGKFSSGVAGFAEFDVPVVKGANTIQLLVRKNFLGKGVVRFGGEIKAMLDDTAVQTIQVPYDAKDRGYVKLRVEGTDSDIETKTSPTSFTDAKNKINNAMWVDDIQFV